MARIVLRLGSSRIPKPSTTTHWLEDHAPRERGNPFLIGRGGEVHSDEDLATFLECAVEPARLTAKGRKPYAWAHAAIDVLDTEPQRAAITPRSRSPVTGTAARAQEGSHDVQARGFEQVGRDAGRAEARVGGRCGREPRCIVNSLPLIPLHARGPQGHVTRSAAAARSAVGGPSYL